MWRGTEYCPHSETISRWNLIPKLFGPLTSFGHHCEGVRTVIVQFPATRMPYSFWSGRDRQWWSWLELYIIPIEDTSESRRSSDLLREAVEEGVLRWELATFRVMGSVMMGACLRWPSWLLSPCCDSHAGTPHRAVKVSGTTVGGEGWKHLYVAGWSFYRTVLHVV